MKFEIFQNTNHNLLLFIYYYQTCRCIILVWQFLCVSNITSLKCRVNVNMFIKKIKFRLRVNKMMKLLDLNKLQLKNMHWILIRIFKSLFYKFVCTMKVIFKFIEQLKKETTSKTFKYIKNVFSARLMNRSTPKWIFTMNIINMKILLSTVKDQ